MDSAEVDRLRGWYQDRVNEHDASVPGYAAAFAELQAALLAVGGVLVVPPLVPEPRARQLAIDLHVWADRTRTRHEHGEPSQCHTNTATLWLAKEVADIATGYALTAEDGLWRQHTWGLDADGTVVETTVDREAYAGVVLDEVAAWRFAASNVGMDDAVLHPDRLAALPKIIAALDQLEQAATDTGTT